MPQKYKPIFPDNVPAPNAVTYFIYFSVLNQAFPSYYLYTFS